MSLRRFFNIRLVLITIVLYSAAAQLDEWRVVENLAEENPYIVALLNSTNDYVCSGTAIGKRTVLTSGYCTTTEPTYVAVGLAVLNKKTLANLLAVDYTLVHTDYSYVMNATEPSLTQMHSNIGLVFVLRPVLDQFLPPATIGTYFASELVEIELTSVGYGRRYENGNMYVLQHQYYDQSPCVNPRWYYCICGTEIASIAPTHGKDFGNGAPVLYGSDVVCISATSTGAAILKSTGIKYNIFTVIGAYVPWIEKTEHLKPQTPKPRVTRIRKRSKAGHRLNHDSWLFYAVFVFFVFR